MRRTCEFCRHWYDDEEGHDYDKCVEECQDDVIRARGDLSKALIALANAIETQAQIYWRRGIGK